MKKVLNFVPVIFGIMFALLLLCCGSQQAMANEQDEQTSVSSEKVEGVIIDWPTIEELCAKVQASDLVVEKGIAEPNKLKSLERLILKTKSFIESRDVGFDYLRADYNRRLDWLIKDCEENPYKTKIIYDLGEGSGEIASTKVTYGSNVFISDGKAIVPPEGKVFVGWSKSPDVSLGKIDYNPGQKDNFNMSTWHPNPSPEKLYAVYASL